MDQTLHRTATIKIGVGVVVVKEDSVLLIKRGHEPRKGIWTIPGGHLELGETAVDGAKRELLEETGLAVPEVYLVDVVDTIRHAESGEVESQYILIDYWAPFESGEIVAGGDAEDCKWVGIDQIDDYVNWSETRRILLEAHEAASHLRGIR